MARYIRTHTHTCTHTCNDKKQKTRSVRKGLRKDILPPGGELIKEPKKKKNAPKEYRVLSLSTEDAQGKMDAISSILNLSAIDMQF